MYQVKGGRKMPSQQNIVQGTQLENVQQNCSGTSRASCAARGFSKKSRIWATWMPPTPKKDIRSMCAVFAAHGRPGLSHRECHWARQCNSLQCSLVHGSGRLDPTPPTKQDRRASRTRRQGSQDSQKEFRDKSTSQM